MRNYYSLLGVQPNATPEQIRSSYRVLSRSCHPDAWHGQPQLPHIDRMFRAILEAYEVLRDPRQRARYDQDYERHIGEIPPVRMSVPVGSRDRLSVDLLA